MKSVKMQKDAAKLLPWLADRGCPVDIVRIESPIRIEQKNGDDLTRLFDLPDGRTGYALDLRIINEGPGARSIRQLEFRVPWPDFGFQLLQDPRETGGSTKISILFPASRWSFRETQC
jgi:hypothetical protein